MKPLCTRFAVALALAVCVLFPALAAEERDQQAYVVLVGIDKYADPQIKPRPNAEADARALYDLFTNKDYLGVTNDHIRLLLGSADAKRNAEPATHDNVLKAVQWAATRAKRDDLVIIAFVGQGAPLGERSCYFASDSTFKDRAKNAVAAADIEEKLKNLKSQRLCVFLDVNFKGFDIGKETAPDANVTNFYKEFLGKEDNDSNVGRVVFLAHRGFNPSIELPKQGLFASVLLDALKGTADKDGYEPDGLITVEELSQHLEKELPPLVQKHGKTKDEKELVHFVLGGRSSNFSLTRNPAVTPSVESRLAKLDKLAKDQVIAPDLQEEGRNLLNRMPKLEAHRNLRKDYQKLADGKLAIVDFLSNRDKALESMKLKRSAALSFARKVIEATQQVREAYIRDVNQGQLVAWAVRGLYQRIDEKMPQDVKDRLENAVELREADLTILLADVRERLGKREDLDKHKDIDHALQRMLQHLDPYTTYIDPETLAQFERDVRKNYSGVGIQIRKHAESDMLMVVSPIKNSPAHKAGIMAGDIITHIKREVDSDGNALDKPEIIPTKGLPLADAVKKVLGKPDTKVKLTIEREGASKPIDLEITRSTIELETVFGIKRKADESWDYVLDKENQIAYIRLSSFAGNTARDLGRVIAQMEKEGLKGLVLDLRFNPGGLLRSAVTISDMFIDDGQIVSVRPRVGREEIHRGKHLGSYLDFPMVVMVNNGSASASEIVSACLQDHQRATIVGERSYGKGSVQNIQSFDGGQLKLTIASFWRPSGKNLNKSSTDGKDDDDWGVMPDKGFTVKLSAKERDELFEHQHDSEIIPRRDLAPKEAKAPFKDRQLDKALDHLRNQIRTASQDQGKKAG